ncbi:outer membrane efflux protein [Leptospira broomii serovar Hurstbridge str. 5399]|uniref:Outer membrane efflux protein n=1 Tax=Leptospira broomii serovar Hurstbridge str. 5399 TaxID=1049789 RepID=T0F6P2_9LEPT|nr:TolC family protein [Leptospira broomii]EQA43167.1 outer membrane efflux protein [Leptospira broomii serovar Hurstbridge str. 5399]
MKHRILYILALFPITSLFSQSDLMKEAPVREIDFQTYLNEVLDNNYELASRKYNVDITKSEIDVARKFPNPNIVLGNQSADISSKHLPQQWYAGFQGTVELGGKRGARIDYQTAVADQSRAQFADFLLQLRADATITYVNTLAIMLVTKRKEESYKSLFQLAESNAIKLKFGDITELDVTQSQVEANLMKNDLISSESDLRAAALNMILFMCKKDRSRLFYPQGDLNIQPKEYDLEKLIGFALENRPDVIAARYDKVSSRYNLKLTEANRVPNFNFEVANNFYTRSTNATGPSPSYYALTYFFGVTMPLSNMYTGDLEMAKYRISKSEVDLEAAKLKVEVQVKTAYLQYQLAKEQLKIYKSSILADAEKVFQGRMYNYKRGNTTLTDVLAAQRTLNSVYFAYYQDLRNYVTKVVELQRASGIWEISI